MALDPTKPAYKYPANNAGCSSAFNPDMPPSVNENTYCSPEPVYSIDRKRILSGLMNSVDPMLKTSLGICGTPVYLSGAMVSPVGRYAAIVVLQDITIDGANFVEIDSNGAAVDTSLLAGKVLSKGTILNGIFTKVGITVGLCKLIALATPL